ncbi:MAG: hypothetical protein IH594_07130 [Bacteroidales bacterium]|nr:hypothetical protein [Bacteroidales bacterium]
MNAIRKISVITAIGVFILTNTFGQLKEIDFIKGGLGDAQVLFREYLTPYANAFGANLNGGWYNTAKPHKLGGFDITVTVNTAWAPLSALTMDLSTLGLEATLGESANGMTAPTIAGKRTADRPFLAYNMDNPADPGNIVTLAQYEVPNGTGVNIVPLPMAQLSLGLPFGTEVTGRYLPNLDFGNAGSIGLWGVGLKHSIFQHIPGIKRLPVLDGSVQGGYTKLNSYANVNFTPDSYAENLVSDILIFKGQKINLDVEAYTINFVASQTLPVVTFYQAIGYSTTKTRVSLKGNYPISRLETDSADPYFGQVVVTDEDVITDPLDMQIENTKDLRLNAGMRFKLGILTIHFDYTKANYGVVSAGLGISFR